MWGARRKVWKEKVKEDVALNLTENGGSKRVWKRGCNGSIMVVAVTTLTLAFGLGQKEKSMNPTHSNPRHTTIDHTPALFHTCPLQTKGFKFPGKSKWWMDVNHALDNYDDQ
ncbi:hypothetical protein VNO80_08947 [Phaseolus coccineus]|uniref:Uncharacterized protein n=1 Tax=Phaseolus coccineus TaxID=3886 RepID=A0AAN9N5A3_PHACN